MRYTIYHTHIVKHILAALSWLGLKLAGWKIQGVEPDKDKWIMVCAPHTSNWDLILLFAYASIKNIKVRWIGKKSIFMFPFATIMQWMGGVPLDRKHTKNFVQQMAEEFAKHKEMVLAIAPEGTRKKVERWKSGFYWMAIEAKVPLGLAYADYTHRKVGLGRWFHPTGDYEKDLREILEFYRKKVPGKMPVSF